MKQTYLKGKKIFSQASESGAGGSVNDVTASSPLNSSGGNTPNLTIDIANSSNDGYLSSSDWNTFNGKQNALGFTPENVANKSIDGTLSSNSDTLYPSQKAVKTYADGLVTGLLDDRGNYDASSNLFPSTGGSGIAGAILKGDLWYIDTPGTLGGTSVVVGSSVRALADTPGQTSTNWSILNAGLGYIPENSANKGIPNGYASLDSGGLIPTAQLPETKSVLFFQTTSFSPADSATYYFSSIAAAPTVILASNRRFKFSLILSKITNITLSGQIGNNGSNENVNFFLYNVTTSTKINVANFTLNGGINTGFSFAFDSLNITINTTDFYTWGIDAPIFATNPTNIFLNLFVKGL
jgi:hypothetical protein